MPNPTKAQLHQNTPLTNVSVAYIQDPANFVAGQVFPIVPVTKQSDLYYIYDIGDFNRDTAKKRAPGTESAGDGWRTSNTSYNCFTWALHQDIPEEDRLNADSVFDLDKDATVFLTQKMLISRERDWASTFFTTSLWTGSTSGSDITPTNLWDTVASTPIEDVRAQTRSIQKKTGYKPNTLVLGTDVYDAIVDHPDILDRVKHTQLGIVTRELLAAVFEVNRVLVAEGIYNSAAEEATDSMSYIATATGALLCYSAPNPGLRMPSAGYTFAWTGKGNNRAGTAVGKWWSDDRKADRIEIEAAFDHKQIGANLGAYFTAAVS